MSYISFANFVTLIPMEENNNLLLWVQNPPFFFVFAKFMENRNTKICSCVCIYNLKQHFPQEK